MKKLLTPLVAIALFLSVTTLGVVAAPVNVGQHIHVEITNHPTDGHPIPRAPYTFHVTVKAHNQTGTVTRWRVDNEATAFAFRTMPTALGPCMDCQVSFDATVDFSAWTTGRHEIRWHFEVPSNNDGNRQFTSSRLQICIVDCTNRSGRPTPYSGGAGWYSVKPNPGEYATVTLRSSERELQPGHTVRISLDQNATSGCSFLNPNFHQNDPGRVLSCWTGAGGHNLTIPSDAKVGDNLVLVATQANGNAGVFHVKINDGSDQATRYYEIQAWWAKGGVVYPTATSPSPSTMPSMSMAPSVAPSLPASVAPSSSVAPLPSASNFSAAPSSCVVAG